MIIVKYSKQINQYKFYQSLNIDLSPGRSASAGIEQILEKKSFFIYPHNYSANRA